MLICSNRACTPSHPTDHRVAEFREALQIGEETFSKGLLSSKDLQASANRSLELVLVTKALNSGVSIQNARMPSPVLLRLAKAARFEEWYRGVTSCFGSKREA